MKEVCLHNSREVYELSQIDPKVAYVNSISTCFILVSVVLTDVKANIQFWVEEVIWLN